MKITSLTLSTAGSAQATAFYSQALGLPLPQDNTIQAGQTTLRFTEGSDRHHFAFNITPTKIEAARDWLTERGVELIDGKIHHFESWNAHAVYFWDPAGNVVEFIARHDLQVPDDNNPFTPADILSVSEIGLNSPDPAVLAATLMAQTGTTYYRPPSPDFHPVGDEQGLLIIVPTHRPWFPDTRVPALGTPEKVEVDGKTLHTTHRSKH